MKNKIYHTPFEVSTIAKNGSEKFGSNAECKFWLPENDSLKIEVKQHGTTKDMAIAKLKLFLSHNNTMELIEVNSHE